MKQTGFGREFNALRNSPYKTWFVLFWSISPFYGPFKDTRISASCWPPL